MFFHYDYNFFITILYKTKKTFFVTLFIYFLVYKRKVKTNNSFLDNLDEEKHFFIPRWREDLFLSLSLSTYKKYYIIKLKEIIMYLIIEAWRRKKEKLMRLSDNLWWLSYIFYWNEMELQINLKWEKKLIIMKILDIRLNDDETAEKVVRILYTLLLMSRIRILYI